MKLLTNNKLLSLQSLIQQPPTKQNLETLILLLDDKTIQQNNFDKQLLFDTVSWLLSFDEVDDKIVETYCKIGESISQAAEQFELSETFQKLRIQFYEESGRLEDALILIKTLSIQYPNDPFLLDTQKRLQNQKYVTTLQATPLSEITDFCTYIDRLRIDASQYAIFIASCDTPYGPGMTPQCIQKLMSLGLKTNLSEKFRCGYLAVLVGGERIIEQLTPPQNEASYSGTIQNMSVHLVSHGFHCLPIMAKIELNGYDYVGLDHRRGLNFVVYDLIQKCVIDSVSFDTFNEHLICLHNTQLTTMLKNWHDRHPNIGLICYKRPLFPTSKFSPSEKFIKKFIANHGVMSLLDHPNMPLWHYFDQKEDIINVLTPVKSYFDIDGIRKFEDCHRRCMNFVAGHRITTDQPQNAQRTIYLVGGCTILGHGVSDHGTISSQLQRLCNAKAENEHFLVENYGYYLAGTDYAASEEIKILESLPLKDGDIVIIDWGFLEESYTLDLSKAAERPHNYGDIFFDCVHFCEGGCHLIAEKLFEFLQQQNFLQELKVSTTVPLPQPANPFSIVKNSQLSEYKNQLQMLYETTFSVGAIVMNCNPFTLGHRYLIEQAAKQCGHLIIFVVEEDLSIFPFADRFELVKQGTMDLENVIVQPSGKFILSSLTFSEYFNKSELQDRMVDPTMDVQLFATEIAPCLHITKRFVGEEPFDTVTRQYNNEMKKLLPKYGIDVIEMERLQEPKSMLTISASEVRRCIQKRDMDTIKLIVPKTTYQYIIHNLDMLIDKLKNDSKKYKK